MLLSQTQKFYNFTLSHKSSFIPRTSLLWNTLPSTAFHESYNLSSLKFNINKLDFSPFSLFFLSWGIAIGPKAFPRHSSSSSSCILSGPDIDCLISSLFPCFSIICVMDKSVWAVTELLYMFVVFYHVLFSRYQSS